MNTEPIDPASVMAAHPQRIVAGHDWCDTCGDLGLNEFGKTGCCEPYRLAEALAAGQAKVARVEAQRDDWRIRSEDDYVGRPLVDAPDDVRRYYRSVLAAAADRLDSALADQPEQESTRCSGTLGSRPSWMSEGQYDPCRCKLPGGHSGEHACEHTDPGLGLADQPERDA